MKKLIFTFLLIAGLTTTSAFAQIGKSGTTAAEFLRVPVGAKSSSMAAYAANVNDVTSTVLNPAGLADLTTNQAQVEVTDWYLDMTHTFFGAGIPTKSGVVGIHVLALDMGEFDETTELAQGLTGRTFGAYSASFGVSYARYLIPQFTIGGTAKVVYEQIETSTASTLAFDIGTMYDTPFYGIRFGVSVTNIGSKLTMGGNNLIISSDPDENQEGNYEPDAYLVTEGYDLPLMLKVGLSWDVVDNEEFRATLAVDGNNPSNNTQSLSIGGEVSILNDVVQLRAGLPYIGQEDRVETFTGGIGFKYQVNSSLGLAFGYSYQGYEYLGDRNKLSVQIFF